MYWLSIMAGHWCKKIRSTRRLIYVASRPVARPVGCELQPSVKKWRTTSVWSLCSISSSFSNFFCFWFKNEKLIECWIDRQYMMVVFVEKNFPYAKRVVPKNVDLHHPSVCLSVYLSVRLSVCLPVYLSVRLSVYLSVRLSVCLSV